MGEALLVKGLGYKVPDPLDNVPVMATACSLLVTVKDSGGNALPNIPVNCNDGGKWYNYTTNEAGMALFQTNSGQANIIAWNYSSKDGYNMIDQSPAKINDIDAPIGTKNHIIMTMNKIMGRIYIVSNKSNMRFMDTNKAYIQIIGGGGGGGGAYNGTYVYGGSGGGGGAYNEINYSIDRETLYSVTIGAGGSGGGSNLTGSSGGTTSAFGISAVGGGGGHVGDYSGSNSGVGGGSGSFKGGNGGNSTADTPVLIGGTWLYNVPYINGNNSNYISLLSYGGGGGAGSTSANFGAGVFDSNRGYGGTGGGIGANLYYSTSSDLATSGSYGGGGGGGGGLNQGYQEIQRNGASGGAGIVFITIS